MACIVSMAMYLTFICMSTFTHTRALVHMRSGGAGSSASYGKWAQRTNGDLKFAIAYPTTILNSYKKSIRIIASLNLPCDRREMNVAKLSQSKLFDKSLFSDV